MENSSNYSQCDDHAETESSAPFLKRHPFHNYVIAFCFLAGGWALMDMGHTFWGLALLVTAVMMPTLLDYVQRYQQRYPALAQAKDDDEMQRLIEMARREDVDAD